MSEKYRVDTDTVSWLVVPYQDDEKVIASFGLRQNAEELVSILNDQAEEIATLKAALSASSEKLAEIKKIVRAMNRMGETSLRHTIDELVTQWDSADDSAAESTPKQEVTLTDADIEWILKRQSSDGFFYDYHEYDQAEPAGSKPYLQALDDAPSLYIHKYTLRPEYDTPANRAAIEARRKALKGE